MIVRRKHIKSVVDRLLKVFAISQPPVDIDAIAASMAIEVRRAPGPEALSGYFMREPSTGRAIIGINTTHSLVRQRFTLAHELGHFLLHDLKNVHVDGVVKLRGPKSSEGTDCEEIEANEFAAQILIPENLIIRDLSESQMPSLFEDDALAPMLVELADKYKVSRAALGYRIINLKS